MTDYTEIALQYANGLRGAPRPNTMDDPERLVFAQVYATVAVARQLEELTAAVRKCATDLSNIHTVLETMNG